MNVPCTRIRWNIHYKKNKGLFYSSLAIGGRYIYHEHRPHSLLWCLYDPRTLSFRPPLRLGPSVVLKVSGLLMHVMYKARRARDDVPTVIVLLFNEVCHK